MSFRGLRDMWVDDGETRQEHIARTTPLSMIECSFTLRTWWPSSVPCQTAMNGVDACRAAAIKFAKHSAYKGSGIAVFVRSPEHPSVIHTVVVEWRSDIEISGGYRSQYMEEKVGWHTGNQKPIEKTDSGLTPFGQMMAGMVQIQRGLELATDDHEELGQIEASLVVNYVQRATDGIQVKYPNNVSQRKVHWLMMVVLKAYSEKFIKSQMVEVPPPPPKEYGDSIL